MMSPMEALQSALRAGDRLDRYELLCPIASGGMATVWLARLRGKGGFEKLFAIKTIRTELVDDPRFQEMLLDEARIASNIQHPNVAQIFDVGEAREVLFIVMERVDGESLAKIRKLLAKLGAKLPLGIALRVLADACAGLHAAHELKDAEGEALGIVHRDVSPHNILVSSAGRVKVIDFGIAKAQNRQQGETRTGIVKGKVQYMAPEQIKKGRSVDRRADIWALGVCLHELVTGKVPNDGDDHVEVIRKVLSDEPPPVAEGLPDAIMLILSRSLALDPDARYPTASVMQRALEDAMRELGAITTSEDIAAFLRSELPELEERSREAVSKSMEEARDRGAAQDSSPGEDVAFAPTMIGQRDALAPSSYRERTRPPARTRGIARSAPRGEFEQEFEQDDLRIPKHNRAWLWLLLILVASGAGAKFGWPKQTSRVLGKVAAVLPWPSLFTSTAAPPATRPPLQPSAVPSAIGTPASAIAVASASASPGGHARPAPKPASPRSSALPASALAAPSSAVGSTNGTASAPRPAPAMGASASAEPAPAGQPAASAAASAEDDAGNPYGN